MYRLPIADSVEGDAGTSDTKSGAVEGYDPGSGEEAPQLMTITALNGDGESLPVPGVAAYDGEGAVNFDGEPIQV